VSWSVSNHINLLLLEISSKQSNINVALFIRLVHEYPTEKRYRQCAVNYVFLYCIEFSVQFRFESACKDQVYTLVEKMKKST
jgi:hypothetical protein